MRILRTKATIEHPLLEPFEPKLKALLELGFDGGIRSLEASGYKLGDDLVNDDAHEHFNNGLFSSFGQTQAEIGKLFINLETMRQELHEKLKRQRGERDQGQHETETLLEAIGNRQLILRRLMDGILWVLLPKVWIANHLSVKGDVTTPDTEELKRLLAIASMQNDANKREIHLVSNLTTFVQIGDIVRIRWDENGVYIRLQEVKFGQVNDTLCDIIDSEGGVLSDSLLAKIESKLGTHAKVQAQRMTKQRGRMERFASTIENSSRPPEVPKDALMESLTRVVPPTQRSYLNKLPELVSDAKSRGFGILIIDDCLLLFSVTEKWLADFGDVQQLPHWIFHIKNPGLKCERGEIEALKRESPLVNLAGHNMTRLVSRSPLIWYPKDLVLDVVMGRVVVFAQFDLQRFFKIAMRAGFELSLIKGKQVESYMRSSSPLLEDKAAYGVNVKFANGKSLPFRPSVFNSIFSHLIPPSEILRLISIVDETQQKV
jgi:hypothetical protein